MAKHATDTCCLRDTCIVYSLCIWAVFGYLSFHFCCLVLFLSIFCLGAVPSTGDVGLGLVKSDHEAVAVIAEMPNVETEDWGCIQIGPEGQ